MKAEELKKRIEEMEALLKIMEAKYEEMKRDNEILRKAVEDLKRENELLRGEDGGGEAEEKAP
ncbi:hypothetical protein [Thermococcus sp.]